jgi:hypothetical protein
MFGEQRGFAGIFFEKNGNSLPETSLKTAIKPSVAREKPSAKREFPVFSTPEACFFGRLEFNRRGSLA